MTKDKTLKGSHAFFFFAPKTIAREDRHKTQRNHTTKTQGSQSVSRQDKTQDIRKSQKTSKTHITNHKTSIKHKALFFFTLLPVQKTTHKDKDKDNDDDNNNDNDNDNDKASQRQRQRQ